MICQGDVPIRDLNRAAEAMLGQSRDVLLALPAGALLSELHPAEPALGFEHREHHRQTPAVPANDGAAGRPERGRGHQRLDLGGAWIHGPEGNPLSPLADAAGIQFRLLNRSKGPAVRGPRAQSDRKLYREAMQAALGAQEGLTIEAAGASKAAIAAVEAAGGSLTVTAAAAA